MMAPLEPGYSGNEPILSRNFAIGEAGIPTPQGEVGRAWAGSGCFLWSPPCRCPSARTRYARIQGLGSRQQWTDRGRTAISSSSRLADAYLRAPAMLKYRAWDPGNKWANRGWAPGHILWSPPCRCPSAHTRYARIQGLGHRQQWTDRGADGRERARNPPAFGSEVVSFGRGLAGAPCYGRIRAGSKRIRSGSGGPPTSRP